MDAVNAAPPASIFTSMANDLVVDFTDASTGTPDTWSWDFGDGNSSTDPNPSHTYFTPGTYTVCLTVSNACGSNTSCETITVSVVNPGVVTFNIGTESGQPGQIIKIPLFVENFHGYRFLPDVFEHC